MSSLIEFKFSKFSWFSYYWFLLIFGANDTFVRTLFSQVNLLIFSVEPMIRSFGKSFLALFRPISGFCWIAEQWELDRWTLRNLAKTAAEVVRDAGAVDFPAFSTLDYFTTFNYMYLIVSILAKVEKCPLYLKFKFKLYFIEFELFVDFGLFFHDCFITSKL